MSDTAIKLVAQLPKTRIKCDWPGVKRLALRLAPLRLHGVVELFTDAGTLKKITRSFVRHHRLRVLRQKISENITISPLGFRYSTFQISKPDDDQRCELRVATHDWLDVYRKARLQRGWKSAMALAVDWSDVDIQTYKIGDRQRHRLIYFK